MTKGCPLAAKTYRQISAVVRYFENFKVRPKKGDNSVAIIPKVAWLGSCPSPKEVIDLKCARGNKITRCCDVGCLVHHRTPPPLLLPYLRIIIFELFCKVNI